MLRRVESGETLLMTVAGRPVAELSPAARRRWVSGPALAAIWHGLAPRGLGTFSDYRIGELDVGSAHLGIAVGDNPDPPVTASRR